MPSELANILLSNGSYSNHIDNLIYDIYDKQMVKVFYNDGTSIDTKIIGYISIRDPEDFTELMCYEIDPSNCHHYHYEYSEIENEKCEHRVIININRVVYIDNKWLSIRDWLKEKYYREHPGHRWFSLRGYYSRYGQDIIVDFNQLDESKEPCVNINGLLVRLINYEPIFPKRFENYRQGKYKRHFSIDIYNIYEYEPINDYILSEVERLSGKTGFSFNNFYKSYPLFNINSVEKATEYIKNALEDTKE